MSLVTTTFGSAEMRTRRASLSSRVFLVSCDGIFAICVVEYRDLIGDKHGQAFVGSHRGIF
jgi:hypothetical protein